MSFESKDKWLTATGWNLTFYSTHFWDFLPICRQLVLADRLSDAGIF